MKIASWFTLMAVGVSVAACSSDPASSGSEGDPSSTSEALTCGYKTVTTYPSYSQCAGPGPKSENQCYNFCVQRYHSAGHCLSNGACQCYVCS
jgi:hypothetical protein